MTLYLQDRTYYEDLYDLHTIEECLSWFNNLKRGMEQHRAEFKPEPPHHTDFDDEVTRVCSYFVNTLAINRYRHKKDSLDKWMEKDKNRQDIFDSATPLEIKCDKCGFAMKVIDKNLHDASDTDLKVTFMYECITCKFRKILYSDGSKWEYVEPKCPECHGELKSKYAGNKKKLTTTNTCSNCSYKNIDVIDFEKNRLEREKEEKRRAGLFTQWRSRFCLNDVDGPSEVANLDGIVRFNKEMRERDIKEKDPIFQQAKKLTTLKINQLKDLIAKTVSDHGFTDLQFGQPEMDKFVIVNFTATDGNDHRKEFDSTNTLRKLIKSALETTNWRLMSEGIHYRLGIVSGRLKAYEHEDDLMSLVKDKE